MATNFKRCARCGKLLEAINPAIYCGICLYTQDARRKFDHETWGLRGNSAAKVIIDDIEQLAPTATELQARLEVALGLFNEKLSAPARQDVNAQELSRLQRKNELAEQRIAELERKLRTKVEREVSLRDRVIELQFENAALRMEISRKARPPPTGHLPKDKIRSLLQLCHPDKHAGSPRLASANEVTKWLLSMR